LPAKKLKKYIMIIVKEKPYLFGMADRLPGIDIKSLVSIFSGSIHANKKGLNGRGDVIRLVLDNGVTGIVKQYRRGGVVRYFIREYYLRKGTTRCQAEYQMLEMAKAAGVSVPKPIAWATTGTFFYKGWLVTKEIENSISLVDYYDENKENYVDIFNKTILQMRTLIKNRILHVDLHPGNVLVSNHQVYIIDFDKAVIKDWDEEKLRRFYLQRWRRAVLKYGLDTCITDYLSEHL